MDDVIVSRPSEDLLVEPKHFLDSTFTIKDLGLAKYFLGMEIARTNSGITFNQRKYILAITTVAGLIGSRLALTPFPPGTTLSSKDGDLHPDPEPYRRIIGQLLYSNLTRSDISYAAQQLSQFVARPTTVHWNTAMHVLRYLKGCLSLGLTYSAACPLSLRAFSDADWGTCKDSRRSLTATVCFLEMV